MIVRSLPDGKRGRVLAWAIAVVMASLTWAFVVTPLQYYYSNLTDRRESLRLLLAREMSSLGVQRTLLARDRLIHTLPDDRLVSGSTDDVAAATLQERVQAMASAVHANVRSIETLSSHQVGAYRRIAVRFDLTGEFQILIELFQAIQESSPEVLVNDTQIRSDAPGPTDTHKPLECTFTVYAFRTDVSFRQPQ
jgi:hypothetical protein